VSGAVYEPSLVEINITAVYISAICSALGISLRLVTDQTYKLLLLAVAPVIVAFATHYFHAASAGQQSGYFSWAIGPVLLLALRGAIFMAVAGFFFGQLRFRSHDT
jgi:hypothetical protein